MNYLKKIGIKVKLFILFLFSIISFLIYLSISGKMKAKDKVKHDLAVMEAEIKLAELEKDSVEKVKKIEKLKESEAVIKEKIKVLEEMEFSGKEVSLEELDNFFDKRGL